MSRDTPRERNFILQTVGMVTPFPDYLPMARAKWFLGNVNESNSIMDSSGQARTLTLGGVIPILDLATTNTSSADRITVTFSHTCTGSNLGLLVYVGHADADVRAADTVTYNGVSMTSEVAKTKTFVGGEVVVECFSLIAPASGANDVVVTWDTDVIASWVVAISYTNTNQTDLVGATGNNSGDNNSPSVSVTTTIDNSMIVAGYTFLGGDGDPSTPGDTERWDIVTGVSTTADIASAGGELLKATAGAGTVNMTANAFDDWAMVGVELKAVSIGFGIDDYMPYPLLLGGNYWSRADEAGLETPDALTEGGYFFFDNTASAVETMIGKWTEGGNERGDVIRRDASGNIEALVSSNGTAETSVTSTSTVASGTWVFVALRYDPSTALDIFIGQDGADNGVLEKVTNTTSIPAALNDSAADFAIGARDTSGTAADFMTGRAGGLVFRCNAVFTENQINMLYSQLRLLIGA